MTHIGSPLAGNYTTVFWLLVLIAVFGTIVSLLFDAWTNHSFTNTLSNAQKVRSDDEHYRTVWDAFDELRTRFRLTKCDLYIADADTVNAFAVQTPTRRAVVLNRGLLHAFLDFWNTNGHPDPQNVTNDAIAGVIAHEMSHLRNGDYLPGWILNGVLSLAHRLKNLATHVLSVLFVPFALIPILGLVLAHMSRIVIVTANSLFFLFERLLHKLVSIFDSVLCQSMEYRCDRQGASAVGSTTGFYALLTLAATGGAHGYIFGGTHPPTIPRVLRIYRTFRNYFPSSEAETQFAPPVPRGSYFGLGVVLLVSVIGTWFALEQMGIVNTSASDPVIDIVSLRVASIPAITGRWSSTISVTALQVWDQLSPYLFAVLSDIEVVLDTILAILPVDWDNHFASGVRSTIAVLLIAGVAWCVWSITKVCAAWFTTLVVMLPYRLALRSKINTREETPIDPLLYLAVDINSPYGALQALKAGANPTDLDGSRITPVVYAMRRQRRRVALVLGGV